MDAGARPASCRSVASLRCSASAAGAVHGPRRACPRRRDLPAGQRLSRRARAADRSCRPLPWSPWRSCSGRRPTSSLVPLWATLGAFVVVVVVVGFNLRYGAQEIIVSRDQGTYGLTAQWLAHHRARTSPATGRSSAPTPGSARRPSASCDAKPGYLQSQYPNAAPMLVAMGGWISDAWLLRIAPLIGGVALLAFFGLARGVVKDWWALGAMTLLAVSLPMMHFSRAVYSEPIAMVFLLGGMGLLFLCEQRGGVWLHLAAGLTGGRHRARPRRRRRLPGRRRRLRRAAAGPYHPAGGRTFGEVSALLLAALVPYFIGMRVIATLSPAYWFGPTGHWRGPSAHAPEAVAPGLAALLILLVGVPFVAVAWRGGSLRARASGCSGGPPWSSGSVLLIVAALVGASRPLWFTAHQYIGPTFSGWIKYWQTQEHCPDRRHPQLRRVHPQLAQLVRQRHRGHRRSARHRLAGQENRPYGQPAADRVPAACSCRSAASRWPTPTSRPTRSGRCAGSCRSSSPASSSVPPTSVGASVRYGRGPQVGVGVLCLAALVLTLQTAWPLATTREGVPAAGRDRERLPQPAGQRRRRRLRHRQLRDRRDDDRAGLLPGAGGGPARSRATGPRTR